MLPLERCHIWPIMGLGSFFWFRLFSGPGFIGLLVGVLTYVSLVGVDYKVIDASHSLCLWCLGVVDWVGAMLGQLRALKQVKAMLADYVLLNILWPYWSTTCFWAYWGLVGRLYASKEVGAMLVDYVLWSRLGPCWLTMCFGACWGQAG